MFIGMSLVYTSTPTPAPPYIPFIVTAAIFHLFEAGIANAIANFKWIKNTSLFEKLPYHKLNYLIIWESIASNFVNFTHILFVLKLDWSCIYRVQHYKG